MKHIAIIGAGMAGLTAAHALRQAGLRPVVFEKSRGTGGRLATRRHPDGPFDHGAPHAQGNDAFDAAMAQIGGVRQGSGWRGEAGMSGLLKPLVRGDEIRNGIRIDTVRHDRRWRLGAVDETFGPFDALIAAVPAPQLAFLFPQADLGRVRMTARWSLMLRWPGLTPPAAPVPPFEAIVPQTGADRWVAHADADWSAAHLEFDAQEVAGMLVAELSGLSGATAAPAHVAAHRWRYARTAVPLGRPYAELGPGAFGGGDWALGPLAGDAWASGRAMAAAVIAHVEGGATR